MEKSHMFERVMMGADLSTEIVPGQSLVEISGTNRVLVENHCGVTAYGCNEICIKVRSGCLCICGSGLELVRMTKQQLVVLGQIDCVRLRDGR